MSAKLANDATMESPGGAIVPIISETIVQPVAATSRRLYEKLISALHYYFEQWEDLVVEAKEMIVPGGEEATAAEILTHLTEAKVVSDLPGRVRLRVKHIKGRSHLAEQSAQALGSLPGIRQVTASSLTGSILIFYDKGEYATRDDLMRALTAS